jgi:peptidoglycan/LPS O-acetylase OafA/YrhL
MISPPPVARLPLGQPVRAAAVSPPQRIAGSRVDFLDHWRGIAVLSVFIYHCFGAAFGRFHPEWHHWLPDLHVPTSFILLFPATWGWAGVSVFFVISGFCIHLSFHKKPTLRDFYYARFFRIYPPYLAALLFFAFIYPFSRLPMHSVAGAEQLISHVLLIHNFNSAWTYSVTPSFWTIAVEAQLYLLYPVLLVMAKRIGWRNALFVAATVEFSLRLVATAIFLSGNTYPPEWIGSAPFTYWFSWGVGAAIGAAYVERENLPFVNYSPALFASLGAICIMVKPLFFMAFPMIAIATAAVISRSLERGGQSLQALPNFCREHLRQTGVWSYSIYLLHQPFLLAVGWLIYQVHIVGSAHPVKIFLLCLGAWIPTVVIASMFFRFCERPSIELGKIAVNLRSPLPRLVLPAVVPE